MTGPYHSHTNIRYANNTIIINTQSQDAYLFITNQLETLNIKYASINPNAQNIHKITLKGLPLISLRTKLNRN